VMLIDDDGGNVKNAKKVGHKDSFHFDIEAMKKIDKKSAPNAYLAFLIVKFGYEQKLSEHIERLNLGPMIEHFKAQQALTQGAEQKVGAGLDRAGALPIIGARTRKPESPGSSLSGSPEGQEVSSPPVTRGRGV